jgi:hypothetical protein
MLGLWNIYRNYPALDRSQDVRPSQWLAALTDGLSEKNALLLTDLNWQQLNGLTHFGQHVRPEVVHEWLADIFIYAPALVRDSASVGRRVFVTERGVPHIQAAYGPVLRVAPDRAASTIDDVIQTLAPGTRYVLCVLEPTREFPLDRAALASTVARLIGRQTSGIDNEKYVVLAGRVGHAPDLVRSAARPFRTRVTIDGLPIDIRMESWLEFDTIRRMGFGHVIANRHHALIVERGVSFVALDEAGKAVRTAYAAGIYEPQTRYEVLSSY